MSGDGDLRGGDDMGKGSITFASKRGQNVGWKGEGWGEIHTKLPQKSGQKLNSIQQTFIGFSGKQHLG